MCRGELRGPVIREYSRKKTQIEKKTRKYGSEEARVLIYFMECTFLVFFCDFNNEEKRLLFDS